MSKAKYTIVIPTRNRQKYCVQAVQSILLTERSDIQVIVCDNSDDGALLPQLLDEAGVSGHVTLLKSEDKVLPMRDNWERAIAHIEAEWVCYIGDDDGFSKDGFSMLDYFIEHFSLKVFTWRPTYYKWPCFPENDRGVLNVYFGEFIIGVGQSAAILNNHMNWVTKDKWPNAGPSVYHCLVHVSVIEKTIERFGRYFLNFVVDYSTAMSNCLMVDSFMQYTGPVTIMGACGHSNTAGLTAKGTGAKKIDEFFSENPNLKTLFEEFEDSKLHVPVVAAGYSDILGQLGLPFNITPEKFAVSFRNELARVRDPQTFQAEKDRLIRFCDRHGLAQVGAQHVGFTESRRPVGLMKDPMRMHFDTTAFNWTGILDVARHMEAIRPDFDNFKEAHSSMLEQLKKQVPHVLKREELPRHSIYDMKLQPLEDVSFDDLPPPPPPAPRRSAEQTSHPLS